MSLIATKFSKCSIKLKSIMAPYNSCRHVGDLGNIEEDRHGRVRTTIRDHMISLSGPNSIIGLAIVVGTP